VHIKITCPFTLPSSHEIHEIEFRGSNNLELQLPVSCKNFLELDGASIKIYKGDNERLHLCVISDSLHTKETQIKYIERAAEYISFLVNQNEVNPQYGTNFVQMEWFDFKAVQVDEIGQPLHSGLVISDSLAISSTRTVQFEEEMLQNGNYHDVLRFYFDGLRAEHSH
jgi:hypothetical protein